MTHTISALWIDRPNDIVSLVTRAKAAGKIAVDTEADSFHSYFHKLCLIQISFDGINALIDPLRLKREELAPLTELLNDPTVITLMHGADYDMRVLDRDLGANPMGIRDTQSAAMLLGEPKTGLDALLEKELGITVQKKFQRADWGKRPLSLELCNYASGDTAHLEALTLRLEARLTALGRISWWHEECTALEQIRFEKPEEDPLAFERVKGSRKLKGEARDRFAALYTWREKLAARLDRPPFHILSPKLMIRLAQDAPDDGQKLSTISGISDITLKRNGAEILTLLSSPPRVSSKPKLSRRTSDNLKTDRLQQVQAIRDAVAKSLEILPSFIATRRAIEEVTRTLPTDHAALAVILGRNWRAEVLAQKILPLMQQWRD